VSDFGRDGTADVTKISPSRARPLAYRVRVVERATRDEILPVRHSVLRPGLPLETAYYPDDDGPDVFHLAERARGAVIACATFFPEPLDGEPAWRFRGMATLPEYRNRGVGGRLLEPAAAGPWSGATGAAGPPTSTGGTVSRSGATSSTSRRSARTTGSYVRSRRPERAMSCRCG
jgi:GNAT superfamily N-acetyltransferase